MSVDPKSTFPTPSRQASIVMSTEDGEVVLDAPAPGIKEYVVGTNRITGVVVAGCGEQGRRPSMEDKLVARLALPHHLNTTLLVVLDGHGDNSAVSYVHQHLADAVDAVADLDDDAQLQQAILALDVRMARYLANVPDADTLEEACISPYAGGTCMVAALITRSTLETADVILLNLGDSRAAVVAWSAADVKTVDHKPDTELVRIEACGGRVVYGRVNGNLAVSRALGDFELKRRMGPLCEATMRDSPVSALADVFRFTIQRGDVLVLYCDGLYESLTAQDVGNAVSAMHVGVAERSNLHDIGRYLLEQVHQTLVLRSIQRGSGDNVSTALAWIV